MHVIQSVAPSSSDSYDWVHGNMGLVDRISILNAHQTVRLTVRRAGTTRLVPVKLGSLADPSVGRAIPPRSFEYLTV